MAEYSLLTGLASDVFDVAEVATGSASDVVQRVIETGAAPEVVTLAVVGGGAYYGYRRYNAE